MDFYKWDNNKKVWRYSHNDKPTRQLGIFGRRNVAAGFVVMFLSVLMMATGPTLINLATQTTGILAKTQGGTGISSTATFPASGTIMTTTTGVTASQLPNPSASTLGGVESLTCSAGSHILSISTSGVPSCSSDAGSPNFATHEIPTPATDGTTTAFTLAHTPTSGSQECYVGGLGQDPGAGNDYTISGVTITFNTAPASGAKLWCSYRF